MFKNRGFLVKMVKDPSPDPKPSQIQSIDYAEIAKLVTRSVSTCIAVYVGTDTIRRIVIYAISAKF